ncbi:peptidase inhibitor family I36 protein [Silvibacterium sp.]|uniref:peptidase inhibitor family I36 protein n=1 Tax=Silvibacterium sp. TaxID=1964179 RepID=UPI0039E3E232
MKRFAAVLTLLLAVSATIAQNYPPPGQRPGPPPGQQGDPWAYGPNNNAWRPDWNNRPNPRRGACFFTTAPFRGNRFCVRAGDKLPGLPGNIGGNISSVQIFGGAQVRLFNDSNFRNGSVTLRNSVPDLRRVPFRGGHTWNNRVSSLMVF